VAPDKAILAGLTQPAAPRALASVPPTATTRHRRTGPRRRPTTSTSPRPRSPQLDSFAAAPSLPGEERAPGWRTDWRMSRKSPANRQSGESVENRCESLPLRSTKRRSRAETRSRQAPCGPRGLFQPVHGSPQSFVQVHCSRWLPAHNRRRARRSFCVC
jgi:hypothetical protein